jgi:hypothetical protein
MKVEYTPASLHAIKSCDTLVTIVSVHSREVLDASGIEPSRPAGGKSKALAPPLRAKSPLRGALRAPDGGVVGLTRPVLLAHTASNIAFAGAKSRPRLRLRLPPRKSLPCGGLYRITCVFSPNP